MTDEEIKVKALEMASAEHTDFELIHRAYRFYVQVLRSPLPDTSETDLKNDPDPSGI